MQRLYDTCTVPNCDRPHKSRGYCQTHYMQFRRSSPITETINTRVKVKPAECVIEGCHKEVKGKGLCGMHWARRLRHGHTNYPDRKKPPKPCSVPGCKNHLYSLGACHAHYLKIRAWKAFGFTLQDYLDMHARQKGVCAICGKPETSTNGPSGKVRDLAVDHCHKTKAIRELLCSMCNTGLGCLGDDPALLHRAAGYLLKHQKG